MFTEDHAHTNHCWWNPDQARWVCSSGSTPNPATPRATEPVDVRDMIVVHTAMLREFRLIAAATRTVNAGDDRRVRAITTHLRFLCSLLHHHHAGEDELLWPLLRARIPAAALSSLEAAQAQHGDLDEVLTSVAADLDSWVDANGPASRDQLAGRLEKLHRLLGDHLELEETALLPLAAAVLSTAEWRRIGEAAVESMPKPALVLSFGMFAYEGDPSVLSDMLASAPAVPRLLLPRIAPRVYARRAQRVYGTARP